jgi:hypothetical protein
LEAAAKASKLPFVTEKSIENSSKWVGGVTASADGRRFMWTLADPQTAVSVTGLAADKPLFELPGRGNELPAAAFAPDGKRIAVGFASDGFTSIWEVPEPIAR